MHEEGDIELCGTVEHIVYRNEESGFSICELAVEGEDGEELITVLGTLPLVAVGEGIRALGRFETHPVHGRQFRVRMFEKQLPQTEASVLKYLASGAIRGIGPVSAQRIVGKFGTDTFDVLEIGRAHV